MFRSTIEERKAESDGHDGCGIGANKQAPSTAQKQLRRYLEELLSNATPLPK